MKSGLFLVFLLEVALPQWMMHPVSVESFAPVALKPNNYHSETEVRNTIVSLGLLRSKKKDKAVPAPIIEIESQIDWLELLDEYDGIIAVYFHASWCKFCQKFKLTWNRKLARPLGDWVNETNGEVVKSGSGVRFVSVEYGTNKKLCQSLKIKELPTVQFYSKGRLLTSFSCGPKGFSSVQRAMDHYLEAGEEELDQEATMWEVKERSTDEQNETILPMEINEEGPNALSKEIEEETEPTLYLRKRDRLKNKISRRK